MNFTDLSTICLRLIGVLASGETANASDVADAQTIANQMLAAWSAESLNVFTITPQTFNFVAGQATYTMGTGGNFNTARPARIEYASVISNSNPSQPLELVIDMITDQQFQNIPVKATQSTLPRQVYDDGAFPLRNLTYWPVPSDSNVQTKLYTWNALSQFTDLTTNFTFPPGYDEAIKYNLALRMAAEWPGNMSPIAAELGIKALARIKAQNMVPLDVKCDPALRDRQGARFNWLIGE